MHLYFWFIRLAALCGHRKAQLLAQGQREVWSRLQAVVDSRAEGKKWIWFHVSSVGEFEQARPILERLRAEHTPYQVLLTFFSPSGYEMRKSYDQVDLVAYLPFATRANARRFLNLVQPEISIFVKYEFWPAYLKELKKQGRATYIIAAIFRKSQLFFKPWGHWYRRLLHCFTRLYVQDTPSKDLLAKYGITNVVVAGDTRFDRVTRIASESKNIELAQLFREAVNPLDETPTPCKIIVAGSSWPQDEELLAQYMQERKDVKLILVPHEIHEEHLHYIFQLFQGQLVRYTRATKNNIGQCRTLLLDTMGMLSSIYKYADVAYIGGGFGEGIHNTLEAAVWGIPVLFGPKHHKFREAQGLLQAGGGYDVTDYKTFKHAMDDALLHADEMGQKAKAYVQSELGATERICVSLEKLRIENGELKIEN
ncbi:MAG: 3-deoxy-D-manno-octulosonic acid transferase [Paludibacteraceae bacterium]|nr:3-deoxy-D-manno-octulosonic acid transferase [Paludibacteraceae bacterium]